MMKNEKSRRIVIVATLVGLILIVSFYFLIWQPKSKAIEAANVTLLSNQSQLSSMQSQISTLKAFKKELPAAQNELKTLALAIPVYPDLANFLLSLNTISGMSGITFMSVTPSQPQASASTQGSTSQGAANLPAVTAGIQIQGGYFQVLDFLNRLNQLSRLVIVNSVNLSATGGSGGSSTASPSQSAGAELSANIRITIYSQQIPPGVPGQASTSSGATIKVAPPTSPSVSSGTSTTTSAVG
ncbi:type IV pilus inner membrane component PilO [Acidithrix ferrooxidans]|uniref:Pilus assembly protein, PilO n=1 Tax=Acidithrix ferrooxidans TaxID=1280514 RepID=A0A0D8HFN0_9ACTN|nr:type 4a pilus biogenesis protein PilO [Acidithrix ferrooxidans]KJF16775.1 pilus assembly protein, PilO [Acidithrix ferrooxidans]